MKEKMVAQAEKVILKAKQMRKFIFRCNHVLEYRGLDAQVNRTGSFLCTKGVTTFSLVTEIFALISGHFCNLEKRKNSINLQTLWKEFVVINSSFPRYINQLLNSEKI